MTAAVQLYGPFRYVLTMDGTPLRGPLADDALTLLEEGAVAVADGHLCAVGPYSELVGRYPDAIRHGEPCGGTLVPGLVDAHTHLCWVGSRADEYALRLCGATYQTIAQGGGGIQATVRAVRAATKKELLQHTLRHLREHLMRGVTTCEVKSGYGLTVADELKMLDVIAEAAQQQPVSLVATCLAAHAIPAEVAGDGGRWLATVEEQLWPLLAAQRLASRVDIFVEEGAYSAAQAVAHLQRARQRGWQAVVHANQFSRGGAAVAAAAGALTADHLEEVDDSDIASLAQAAVAAVVLPAATLGLGQPFAPARRLLDGGLQLVIASDWNPGSAPMGDLLTAAALLGCQQKLSMAETWAALTVRAAAALCLPDRGAIAPGLRADLVHFACEDWREVLYYQGALKPSHVFVNGEVYYP